MVVGGLYHQESGCIRALFGAAARQAAGRHHRLGQRDRWRRRHRVAAPGRRAAQARLGKWHLGRSLRGRPPGAREADAAGAGRGENRVLAPNGVCAPSATATGSPPRSPARSCSSNTHIDVVEDDHPDRRFGVALCPCQPEVDPGALGGPGDQAEVERMARALLMPDVAFDRLVDRPYHGLAAPAWCRRRSKAAARARRRRSLRARPPRWSSSCGTRPG